MATRRDSKGFEYRDTNPTGMQKFLEALFGNISDLGMLSVMKELGIFGEGGGGPESFAPPDTSGGQTAEAFAQGRIGEQSAGSTINPYMTDNSSQAFVRPTVDQESPSPIEQYAGSEEKTEGNALTPGMQNMDLDLMKMLEKFKLGKGRFF